MKKSESKKGVRVETMDKFSKVEIIEGHQKGVTAWTYRKPEQFPSSDLFYNTEHADTRPEAIKSFQDLQQERAAQRKQNKMDISGLPLFSENEREARITKQERLF